MRLGFPAIIKTFIVLFTKIYLEMYGYLFHFIINFMAQFLFLVVCANHMPRKKIRKCIKTGVDQFEF